MCGIAGILSLEPGAQAGSDAELIGLRDAMAARGPDGSGLWFGPERCIGLAHRRLAIIDPGPAGAQPMTSADGALCLSFNGEIYNYEELRAGLIQDGAVFRSHSDTEVILHLYERHGCALVDHLRGMFAFALWDNRRRGLLLARDPFGIKPLYYAQVGHRLLFASQARPLAARVGGAPDPAGLVGFLLFGSVPEPHTLHQAIKALPAGTTLWAEQGSVGIPLPYFSVRDSLIAAEQKSPKASGGEESRECLRAALLSSVRSHLVSDVPVGLFLSAGIDSGTLLALAREAGGSGLETRTLAFDEFRGTLNDEAPLAQQVARHYGARHQTHRLGAGEFEAALAPLLAAMDLPSIDGVNSYFVAQGVAGSGIKVALSGVGGDELFGGYPGFRQIPPLARILAPLASVPALGRWVRRVGTRVLPRRASPKLAGVLEYGTTIPDAWMLRRALFMPWELPEVLEPELVRTGLDALNIRARLAASVQGVRSRRLQVMALEMEWYLRNQLLRDADWAGMAHGLEIRTPLVDVELFRTLAPLLAAPTPPTKHDFQALARPALPEAIASRPKTGFSTPLAGWLAARKPARARRGLRDWALTVLRQRVDQGIVMLPG